MSTVDPLVSTTHIVAHLLREIESALRDVLEPVMDRSEGYSEQEASRLRTHEIEIRATLKGLDIPESEPIAQAWLRLPGQSNEYSLHARAHRDALSHPRPISMEFRSFWGEMEAVLDVILERFEERYLTTHIYLDNLLAKDAPSRNDARRLRTSAPNNAVASSYFFGKLTDAAWLEPLRAEGFFNQPPEPEYDHNKGSVRFPLWPASQYLVRVAHLAPQTVLEISLEVPETDNIHVPIDIAEIALALPAALTAQLVPRFINLAPSRYQTRLPERLGAVVEHLAKSGEADASIELAKAVLAPDRDSHRRGDLWHYERMLTNNIPPLIEAIGDRALVLLCDLLEEAIEASSPRGADGSSEDYSEAWRPTIDDHKLNRAYDARSHLVSAIRDGAEQIAEADPNSVRALVAELDRRRWLVFRRLGLHLLRMFPIELDLIAARLTDRTNFDSSGLYREYVLLLKECYSLLSGDDRDLILDWISKGPDIETFRTGYENWNGRPATDEDVMRYVDEWQRDKLAPIRDALPETWRRRLDALVVLHGEPRHPENVPDDSTWVGLSSPQSVDELSLLGITELVEFLQTWNPSQDWRSPSREGLGQELKVLVAANPDRFAPEAGAFQVLDPTYVQAFISGLRLALKENRSFSWRPILEFCRWVVDQPRYVGDEDAADRDRDPHWRWTRKEIAHLLSAGFEPSEGGIPYEERLRAWEVLSQLTTDPDPTPEDEQEYGGTNMDPLTLSLNTVRGEAMHAVVRYALWVRRHLEDQANSGQLVDSGMVGMPEAASVLEAHLDPEREPSLAIRAVYGQWFPSLVYLDGEWTRTHVPQIFPRTRFRNLLDAAWETYISLCRPYDSVVDMLHEEYALFIDRLDEAEPKRRRLGNPNERLAEHLMSCYWSGKLNLDESDGLLVRFYARAPVDIRAHALEFLGRSVHGTTEGIAPEVIRRLKDLWVTRLDAVRMAPASTVQSTELVPFGWWFASKQFDEEWSSNQLKQSLELAGQAEPDHLVVEQLVHLAERVPVAAVQCLKLIIIGDIEGWHIFGWREQARNILTAALTSGDEEVRRSAEALINQLGARGHLDFQDLLSRS